MSSSVRVLDFFVVEATEYIDQMDATLGAARPGGTPPDVDALAGAAHRLRGSATRTPSRTRSGPRFSPIRNVIRSTMPRADSV